MVASGATGAVADNIDLNVILTEFEQYYDIKFGALPLLAKKLAEEGPADPGRKAKSKFPPVKAAQGSQAKDPKTPGSKPSESNGNTAGAMQQSNSTARSKSKPGDKQGGLKGLEIEGHFVDLVGGLLILRVRRRARRRTMRSTSRTEC